MQLYKGKPSKIELVIEADDAFEEAVYCKPPSARSRAVWMETLMKIVDSNDKETEAIGKIADQAINLILITSCTEQGVPIFVNDDREFLAEKLEVHHHDMMVKAGCKIIGNTPLEVQEGMLMDVFKEDKKEDKDENEEDDNESEDDQADNDEAAESTEGKPDTE